MGLSMDLPQSDYPISAFGNPLSGLRGKQLGSTVLQISRLLATGGIGR